MLYTYTVSVNFELSLLLLIEESKSSPFKILFDIHATGWNDVSMFQYSTSYEAPHTLHDNQKTYQFSNNKINRDISYYIENFQYVITKLLSKQHDINYVFANPFYNNQNNWKLPMDELVIHVPSFNVSTTLLGNSFTYIYVYIIYIHY